MADGDSSYDINIKTTRDGAAVAAESQDIKELTGAIAAATAATEKLNVGQRNLASTTIELVDVEAQAKLKEEERAAGLALETEMMKEANKTAATRIELESALLSVKARLTAAAEENAAAIAAETEATLAQQQAVYELAAAQAELAAVQTELAAVNAELAVMQEAATGAAINTRGLGGALTQLGSVMGGLRGLGRAIFNPLALSIIALVEVYQSATKHLKEWNDEMERQAKINSEADWLPMIEARRKGMEDARLEAEKFADTMAHISDPFERMLKQYDRWSEQSKRQAAEANTLAGAQQQYEEAVLEKSLKNRLITQEQFNAAMFGLDEKYRIRKIQAEEEEAKHQIDIMATKLSARQTRQPGFSRATQDAQAKADAAQDQLLKDSEELKALKKDLPNQKTRFEKADEAAESYGGVGNLKTQIAAVGENNPLSKAYRDIVDEFEKAQKEYEQARNKIDAMEKQVPKDRSASAKAGRDRGRSETREEDNAKKIEDLQEELNVLKQTTASRNRYRRDTGTVESATDAERRGIAHFTPDLTSYPPQIKDAIAEAHSHYDAMMQAILQGLRANSEAAKRMRDDYNREVADIHRLIADTHY